MSKVLLVGGSGQLGTEIRRQAADRWEITAPDRATLDAGSPQRLEEAVASLRPDLVVNTSAFHVVDLCESRFGEALAINAVAVSALGKAAEAIGARFVTVSTDYAFDGTSRTPYREEDSASPIQCYGISKVAGERAALAAHPDGAYVLRSCGLYGHAPSRQKAGNFVLNRLADAETRSEIEVGSDLRCTPTSAADLASGLIALLDGGAPPGLYHLTNAGSCDWASFTAEIYRLSGRLTRVRPVDRGGRYGPARRPGDTVLDGAKAIQHGVRLRPWQEALAAYLREIEG